MALPINPLQPVPLTRELTEEQRRLQFIDTAIVRTLYEEWAKELGDFSTYRSYYDGEQPLVFGTDKFQEFFGNFEGFEDNWCAPVIDAATEKIKLMGITLDTEEEGEDSEAGTVNPKAKQIWDVFRDNDIDEQQGDLTEGVFVEGRAAVIVWKDEELGARLDWQPATMVKVRYNEDDYRVIDFAIKRWVTPSGQIRVNVYDPNEVRKYTEGRDTTPPPVRIGINVQTPQKTPTPSLTPWFVEDEPWPLPHDFGEVPVVEFPNKRGSELSDVIPLQNAINYMLLSTFVAGEFAALPQKVFFTHVKEPEGGWSNRPGRVWHVPPGLDSDGKPYHGEMDEFSGASLNDYRGIVEMLLQHLALTSKTPVRMFFKSDRGGRGDAPSGESQLIEDEPLLDKVADRSVRLGNKWFHVAKLVAKALDLGEIRGEMLFEDPRSKYRTNLLDEAIKYAGGVEAGKGLGLPIEWVIKQLALPPEELAELETLLQAQIEEEEQAQAEQLEMEQAALKAKAEAAARPPVPAQPPPPQPA